MNIYNIIVKDPFFSDVSIASVKNYAVALGATLVTEFAYNKQLERTGQPSADENKEQIEIAKKAIVNPYGILNPNSPLLFYPYNC